jgi:hypothetical protein
MVAVARDRRASSMAAARDARSRSSRVSGHSSRPTRSRSDSPATAGWSHGGPSAETKPQSRNRAIPPWPQVFATRPMAPGTGPRQAPGELPCRLRGYRRRGCKAPCCSRLRLSRASFLRFLSFRQRRFDSEPRPIGQTVAERSQGAARASWDGPSAPAKIRPRRQRERRAPADPSVPPRPRTRPSHPPPGSWIPRRGSRCDGRTRPCHHRPGQ